MFGKLGEMMKQFQLVQELLKDEEVRTLLAHPTVQALMKDPEFIDAVKSQDPSKLSAHPKLASVMRDPELAPLMAKLQTKLIDLSQRAKT